MEHRSKRTRNTFWIFFIIGMISVFAYAFGLAFVLKKEPNPLIIIGIVFFLILLPLFVPMIRKSMLKKRLQKEGLKGTGRLLDSRQTGTYINNQPEMILSLEITGQFGDTWEAEMREVIPLSMLYAMAPGTLFSVLYDPQDNSKVVFDKNAGNAASAAGNNATPGTGNLQEAQAAFADLAEKQQALFKRLSVSGIPARAKVLTCSSLGANFNGNNPLVMLLLEVSREDGTTFSGQTTGVISGASWSKFQPGNFIYVKYDPADSSQITITGSDKPDTSFTSNG
jgi:uncharacterized membrane protein YhaH (DUF805 family)